MGALLASYPSSITPESQGEKHKFRLIFYLIFNPFWNKTHSQLISPPMDSPAQRVERHASRRVSQTMFRSGTAALVRSRRLNRRTMNLWVSGWHHLKCPQRKLTLEAP
jgi:hypothetical protein